MNIPADILERHARAKAHTPAAQMTPGEIHAYYGGTLPNRTYDALREQIAWEQHPDFPATTAQVQAKMEADKAASRAGWEAEQAALRNRKNEYEQALEKEANYKKMGRVYYGKGRRR